ncbi:ABC transporter permease, partial [Weizmannia sp. CD-2023]|uniref:ABC transporter permease n=1 Tax=Weizmannia sp. CD-2023 TaxID=3037263 RepID=UPI002DBFC6F1
LSIFIRKYYIFSENYTEQVKHGSRKCTKRVSWNTRYLNLVEKNLTHTQNINHLTGGFFSVFGFSDIKVSTIVYAVVFFLLGYLLYATLAAFLGSLVSRIEDAQQMMMPMTFLVMIGFFLAMAGLGNPSAGYITVLSYIPFFTPMLMFLRVGMLDLPVWAGLSGVAVMVVTIVFMAIAGARIYRGGVLLYGKSNSLKTILKALQMSKEA